MKQKKMLTLTLSQLKQLYQQELPELYQLANETTNETDFKNNLDKFLSLHPQAESNTGKQIRLLINYDGRSIHELSTEQDMPVQTFSLLHRFLTGIRNILNRGILAGRCPGEVIVNPTEDALRL